MHAKLQLRTSAGFWAICGLFVAGLAVRLYELGSLSLYDDEILTAIRIDHSFFDTISLLKHSPFPPLYYAILNLWTGVFGNGEWALRFPSAIFSGLTIIVIYKLGKELFNENIGLISAALLVFSPFAIRYAQFAKPYALFWLLAAVSFLFFFRLLKDQRTVSYVWYIIASILCCYALYTGFVFLVTQSIIFLLFGERRWWGKWFVGQLIIVAFCAPWVVAFLSSSHEVWDDTLPGPTVDHFSFFVQAFLRIIGISHRVGTVEDWTQYLLKEYSFKINCFLYLFLIAFFLLDVFTASYKKIEKGLSLPANHYCLLAWIIISAFVYLTFAYFFIPIVLAARYIGFLQVPIILLVSSQIDSFQRPIKRILVLAMVIVAMYSTYIHLKDQYWIPQRDWRGAAQELAQDLGDKDIVLSLCYIPQFKYYYKGDTSRFFAVSEKDCSAESLVKNGILAPEVQSIFILYPNRNAPEIKLDGFSLDYKVSKEGIGYLHFQRTQ